MQRRIWLYSFNMSLRQVNQSIYLYGFFDKVDGREELFNKLDQLQLLKIQQFRRIITSKIKTKTVDF